MLQVVIGCLLNTGSKYIVSTTVHLIEVFKQHNIIAPLRGCLHSIMFMNLDFLWLVHWQAQLKLFHDAHLVLQALSWPDWVRAHIFCFPIVTSNHGVELLRVKLFCLSTMSPHSILTYLFETCIEWFFCGIISHAQLFPNMFSIISLLDGKTIFGFP